MIRLPSLNQMLCSHYSELALDNLARSGKVVEEGEDYLLVENAYHIADFNVTERFTVDRFSGKPIYAGKEFKYFGNKIGEHAKDSIAKAARKISDKTNGVFHMPPSKKCDTVNFEAEVCPNGEIDNSVVKSFREIEAIVYLSNELSKRR